MCDRWVGDWTKTATYWPHSSGYSSISFPFSWAAQLRVRGPSLTPRTGTLTSNSDLQLTDFLSHPGYIIVRHPPASCERHICTQFNPSTLKLIPWYFQPDAPVIYTGTFPIRHLGRVGGQYVTYLLEAKQHPTGHACETEYTVKHVLIESTDMAHIRETFYSANDMKELFQRIEMKNIMSFLKQWIYTEKSKGTFNINSPYGVVFCCY